MKIIENIEKMKEQVSENAQKLKESVDQNQSAIDALKGEVNMNDNKKSLALKLAIGGGLIAGVAYISGRKDGIEIGKDQLKKAVKSAKDAGYTQAITDIMGKMLK